MSQEGPSSKTTFSCTGCIHLQLKDWEFYGENDDIDRGTDALCAKENKHIDSYYYNSTHAPSWCPFLQSSSPRG